MLRDQRLQLADEIPVAAEREIRLDSLLARDEPPFLEARDLFLREVLEREIGERRPSPDCKGCVQRPRSLRGISTHERLPAGGEQLLEPVDVSCAGVDAQ